MILKAAQQRWAGSSLCALSFPGAEAGAAAALGGCFAFSSLPCSKLRKCWAAPRAAAACPAQLRNLGRCSICPSSSWELPRHSEGLVWSDSVLRELITQRFGGTHLQRRFVLSSRFSGSPKPHRGWTGLWNAAAPWPSPFGRGLLGLSVLLCAWGGEARSFAVLLQSHLKCRSGNCCCCCKNPVSCGSGSPCDSGGSLLWSLQPKYLECPHSLFLFALGVYFLHRGANA